MAGIKQHSEEEFLSVYGNYLDEDIINAKLFKDEVEEYFEDIEKLRDEKIIIDKKDIVSIDDFVELYLHYKKTSIEKINRHIDLGKSVSSGLIRRVSHVFAIDNYKLVKEQALLVVNDCSGELQVYINPQLLEECREYADSCSRYSELEQKIVLLNLKTARKTLKEAKTIENSRKKYLQELDEIEIQNEQFFESEEFDPCMKIVSYHTLKFRRTNQRKKEKK